MRSKAGKCSTNFAGPLVVSSGGMRIGAVVLALIGASCANQTFRSVAVLAIEPSQRQVLNGDENDTWKAFSKPLIRHAITPTWSRVHSINRLDNIWYLPPQPHLPKGARILDGLWEDQPPSEVERLDVRVVLFQLGFQLGMDAEPGPIAGLAIPNAYSPHIQIYDFGTPETLYVFLLGEGWRSGTYLHILSWNLKSGAVEELLGVGGEEMADLLSYEVRHTGLGKVEIVIYGIRPNKKSGFQPEIEAVARKMGLPVQVEYTGKPW
jgi:hypothetical protein